MPGPRKTPHRIQEKAKKDYGNDLARVVDVQRATGIFDSAKDLSEALYVLRGNARRKRILIRRCKDHFCGSPADRYRDLQFNIERGGFVGELQLNLRQIVDVKSKAHKVYEVERALVKDEKGLGALSRRCSRRYMLPTAGGKMSVFDVRVPERYGDGAVPSTAALRLQACERPAWEAWRRVREPWDQ